MPAPTSTTHTTDPLEDLLRRAPLADAQRATLWDTFQAAANEDALAAALRPLPLPQPLKASLWDLKHQAARPPTLAARVRAKYPGAYDDLDDATLERQVRAKFPGVYDDLPRGGAVTPAVMVEGKPMALDAYNQTQQGAAKPRTLSEPEFDQVKASVLASLPPGLSETEFHRIVGPRLTAALREAETRPPATPPTPTGPSRVDQVADWLPTVGGVVGGLVGQVPGARILTAGIGGAAGEGYKQLLKHGTEIPGLLVDVAQGLVTQPRATVGGFMEGALGGQVNALKQGAIQAAGQGAGEALVGVAAKASPWLMSRALKLTDQLAREFPTMSSTMLEHALTVSKGGLAQARALLGEAKASATAALTTAQAAGARVPATAATDGLQQTLVKVLNSADIDGGLAVLAQVERQLPLGRATALTPVEADALKTSLQTQSKALYKAVKMGQGPPNVSIRAQALADMAESLNHAIGTITTQAGAPGYRAANASAQELIGATRGIVRGMRPAPLAQALVRPGVGAVIGGQTGGWQGAATGAVAGALASPAGLSRLAVTLQRPAVQATLRSAPKLAAAVASLLAAEGQTP